MILNTGKILKRLHTFVQSKEPLIVKSLKQLKYGEPSEVLHIEEEQLIATNSDQVLVKILAAPIHSTDIELIKGKNPERKLLPSVLGRECVGEVVSIGENVKKLSIGQRIVVPYADTVSDRGTWSTYALYDSSDLTPISSKVGIVEAATLTGSPCTAYRILKDFIKLRPGDCILFNGGNTTLGHSIHQLCRAWNYISVGIVNERPNLEEVKSMLKNLGATEILTLKELKESKIFENGMFPRPRLSLSCVKRSSSKELGYFLDRNGVMITYGCMAGYPVATATAALIFKDFVQRPFWMIRWNKYNPKLDERNSMIAELCTLVEKNQLHAPEWELIPFADYKEAFDAIENNNMENKRPKFLLDMRCEE